MKKKLIFISLGILTACGVGVSIWLGEKAMEDNKWAGEFQIEEKLTGEELQQEISADGLPDLEGEEPEKLSEVHESPVKERDLETIKEHFTQYSNDSEELFYSEAYVAVHGKEKWGTVYLEKFLENVEQKKPAKLDIIQFTVEGDAIIYYLNYNGEDFYMAADYSRDAFKGNGASYEEWIFPYLKIFENTGENGEEYREFYLTEDDSITLDDINEYDSGNVQGEEVNCLYIMTIVDFVGYDGIAEDILSQLEVFAETFEEWKYQDMGPYACSYAVYDLDRDGQPELLTKVVAGSGLYSENHFYQVNERGDGICELKQQYYYNNAEFDLDYLEFPAYVDQEGTIYYSARDVEKSGYLYCYYTDGFFYLKDGAIHNEAVRISCYDGNLPEGEQNIYYSYGQEETVIDEAEWERLYSDYTAGMTEKKVKFPWFQLGEADKVSQEELLKLLVTSYKEGI